MVAHTQDALEVEVADMLVADIEQEEALAVHRPVADIAQEVVEHTAADIAQEEVLVVHMLVADIGVHTVEVAGYSQVVHSLLVHMVLLVVVVTQKHNRLAREFLLLRNVAPLICPSYL
jgi:hypothetical protein